MKRAVALLALSTTLAASVPAEARDRSERRHHRHRDRDKGEDAASGFVAGALVVGLIAALAGSKKKPAATTGPAVEEIAFVRADAPAPAGVETDADSAIAACAVSVEEEGRRDFPLAQMGRVSAVEAAGSGYAIRGDLLVRRSYGEAGVSRPFRCAVDAGGVREVVLEPVAALP